MQGNTFYGNTVYSNKETIYNSLLSKLASSAAAARRLPIAPDFFPNFERGGTRPEDLKTNPAIAAVAWDLTIDGTSCSAMAASRHAKCNLDKGVSKSN